MWTALWRQSVLGAVTTVPKQATQNRLWRPGGLKLADDQAIIDGIQPQAAGPLRQSAGRPGHRTRPGAVNSSRIDGVLVKVITRSNFIPFHLIGSVQIDDLGVNANDEWVAKA